MESVEVKDIEQVVIKFAGDSGDGMQLSGTQFTETSALFGNDLATFPDYPAEIRAPQGTVAGVSGFQVHIGHNEIKTPGDICDVLVAMNPAALKANTNSVRKGGTIIVDVDSFAKRDLEKAGYSENPIDTDEFNDYILVKVPISSFTRDILKNSGLDGKSILRCKNMFALGIIYWLFNRSLDHTNKSLSNKFKKKPPIVEANLKVLKAGYNYAEHIQVFTSSYNVKPAPIKPGTYKSVMGNQATAWGFLAAAERSGRPLYLGSYPITPASDILHELAKYRHFGATIVQAEDEIAGVCSAIGASFSGNLALTTTSGPGLALKGEAIGLATIAELPLVIVNVQRGGPSTGLPTKTEQSDLMQALYGRNGESPVIVIAASTPSNCFYYAYMASKLALEHMTPVILMTDGYLGNGSEPWLIQSVKDLPDITPNIAHEHEKEWLPYKRDPETLARMWAIPGIPGLAHRIGGLEKDYVTGNVSYDPDNHEKMTKVREEKVQRVKNYLPDQEVLGLDNCELLVVGWGGTFGALYTAVNEMIHEGNKNVAFTHFNFIKPLPKNTAEIFSKYKKIVVCELNNGQFIKYLQSELPQFKYQQINKIKGLPFYVENLKKSFTKIIG